MLGSAADKTAFADVFSSRYERPNVLFVTPETPMGGETFKGIIHCLWWIQNKPHCHRWSASHMGMEWYIQSCFQQGQWLEEPISRCTYDGSNSNTAAERWRNDDKLYLTDLVVLRGSINRKNVYLRLFRYSCPKKAHSDWTCVAEQIKDVVGNHKTIVYCSFTTLWQGRCALLQCGVNSAAYTGHNRIADEKHIIQENMAAEAIGCKTSNGLGGWLGGWFTLVVHTIFLCGCSNRRELEKMGNWSMQQYSLASTQICRGWNSVCAISVTWSSRPRFKSLPKYGNIYIWFQGRHLFTPTTDELFGGNNIVFTPFRQHLLLRRLHYVQWSVEARCYERHAITDALQELHENGLQCVTEKKLLEWLEGGRKQTGSRNWPPEMHLRSRQHLAAYRDIVTSWSSCWDRQWVWSLYHLRHEWKIPGKLWRSTLPSVTKTKRFCSR